MRIRGSLFIPLLAPVVTSQILPFHPVLLLIPSASLHNDRYPDFGTLERSRWRNTTGQPLISNETADYVEQLLDEWDSTGLSLAVVKKDASVTDPAHPGWRIEFGSFGFASESHLRNSSTSTQPMTPDTLFAIASNSKLFLSISVGLLIHNKTLAEYLKRDTGVQLSWKTRVRDLFGEDWTMWDEDIERGATITDLLGHRTGMPRHDFSSVQRKDNVREMIQKLRYLRPSATFRETFQYNNRMYEALSYLPELLLNQTYESYIAQHLFEPLNMTSSTFAITDVDEYYASASGKKARFADRTAVGHLADGRDFTQGRNGTLKAIVPFFTKAGEERTWAGAGGVMTTARDLTTWVAMLLSNGAHPYQPNVTVVPKEVIDFVTHGRSIISGVPTFPDMSPMVYGAAQFRYSYRGLDVLEHGGNNPGFKSQVARFPQKDFGVISLSNDGERGGFVLEAAKWAVVDDLVFGDREGRVKWSERYHKLWDGYQKERREKTTPRPKHPEAPTRELKELGQKKFRHETYGEIALCRVPPDLLRNPYSSTAAKLMLGSAPTPIDGTQQPLISSDQYAIDQDYRNPYTNCTQLLSSPSTLHILSSESYSLTSKPPATFISSFHRTFATHLKIVHFSGNLFNVSTVWANDDVRRELRLSEKDDGGEVHVDSGAMLIDLDETFTLEWVHAKEGEEEGLAITGGIWGMEGPDASEPKGEGREGAEVWFGIVEG